MIDRTTLLRWFFWFFLIALSCSVVFVRLLPLDLTAGRFPGPDVMMAVVFAWVLRRPDYVPVILVAILFFVMDMLYQRVPGVSTMMLVLGLEFLRNRERRLREQHFLVEWSVVAATIFAIMAAELVLLQIFMVEQIPLGRAILQALNTVAIYPLAVFFSVYLFGVRRLQPGTDTIAVQMV